MFKVKKMIAAGLEPATLTFILSILLSLIAVLGTVMIGRDAAFYLDIAHQVNVDGVASAFKRFNWPWYSIFIAYMHKLTGLSYETIAYLYSFLFMAGTSSLIVSMVQRVRPEASYWAVLIVLSMPAFNSFRDDLLRDIGFWFFITLTIWLVLLHNKKINWLQGLFIQLSMVLAMLFRLEAAFVLVAVALFLAFFMQGISIKGRLLNLLKSFSLFFLALLIVLVFSVSQDWYNQPRVASYLSMIQPVKLYDSFMVKSDGFSRIALRKWSYSDAPVIILSGMFFALCLNMFKYGGVASLLFIPACSRKSIFAALSDFKLHAIAGALYFLVLYIFFVERGFINSRYSSLSLLLFVPFFAVAAKEFFGGRKKLSAIFISLSIVMALSNVISTSGNKSYYLDASEWIKNNTSEQDKIYYDNSRIAYYAGRGYPNSGKVARDLEKGSLERLKNYQYFVVTLGVKESNKLDNFYKRGFKSVYKVGDEKKVIYILTHSE